MAINLQNYETGGGGFEAGYELLRRRRTAYGTFWDKIRIMDSQITSR
jgi:hypothetical protein